MVAAQRHPTPPRTRLDMAWTKKRHLNPLRTHLLSFAEWKWPNHSSTSKPQSISSENTTGVWFGILVITILPKCDARILSWAFFILDKVKSGDFSTIPDEEEEDVLKVEIIASQPPVRLLGSIDQGISSAGASMHLDYTCSCIALRAASPTTIIACPPSYRSIKRHIFLLLINYLLLYTHLISSSAFTPRILV